MALDLSKMSDEDLEALSKNDYSKISDAGLNLLVASEEKKKAPVREAGAGRGFVNPPLAGAPKQNLYTESPEMMYSPEGIPLNPASYGGEISGGAKTAQNVMSGIVSAPVAAGLGFGGELLRQAGAVQQLVSPKQKNLSSLIAPQPQSNWLLDQGKQINSFADQMNNPAATVGQLGSYIVPGMGAQKVVQAVGAIPSAISAVRAGTSIPNALRTVAGAAPAATTLGRAGQTAIAGAGTGYVATPGEVDERAMAAAAGAALGAAGEVVIPWAGGFIKGAYNKFKGIEPPKMYNPDLVATSKTPPPIDTLQNMTPMPQNVRAAFPNQMVMPAEGTAGQQSGAAFADYLRSVRPYLDVPNITANAMGVPIPGGALASAVSGIPSGKAINTIARWMGKPNLKAEGVPGFKSESLPEQVISGFQNAMTSRELEKLAAQRMKKGPGGTSGSYDMPMPMPSPNYGAGAYQTPQYNTPTTGPAIPKIPAPVAATATPVVTPVKTTPTSWIGENTNVPAVFRKPATTQAQPVKTTGAAVPKVEQVVETKAAPTAEQIAQEQKKQETLALIRSRGAPASETPAETTGPAVPVVDTSIPNERLATTPAATTTPKPIVKAEPTIAERNAEILAKRESVIRMNKIFAEQGRPLLPVPELPGPSAGMTKLQQALKSMEVEEMPRYTPAKLDPEVDTDIGMDLTSRRAKLQQSLAKRTPEQIAADEAAELARSNRGEAQRNRGMIQGDITSTSKGAVTSKGNRLQINKSTFDEMAAEHGVLIDWNNAPDISGMGVKEGRKALNTYLYKDISTKAKGLEAGTYTPETTPMTGRDRMNAKIMEDNKLRVARGEPEMPLLDEPVQSTQESGINALENLGGGKQAPVRENPRQFEYEQRMQRFKDKIGRGNTMGLMTDDTLAMKGKGPMGTQADPFDTVADAEAYLKSGASLNDMPASTYQQGAQSMGVHVKSGEIVTSRADKPIRAKFDRNLEFDTVISRPDATWNNPFLTEYSGVDKTTGVPVRAKVNLDAALNTRMDPIVEIYEVRNGKEVLTKKLDASGNIIDTKKLGAYSNPFPTKDAFERSTTFAKLSETPYQGTYKQGNSIVQEAYDPKYKAKQTITYTPEGNDTNITATWTFDDAADTGVRRSGTTTIKTSSPEDVLTSPNRNRYFDEGDYRSGESYVGPNTKTRYTKSTEQDYLDDGTLSNERTSIVKVSKDKVYVQTIYPDKNGKPSTLFEEFSTPASGRKNTRDASMLERTAVWSNDVETTNKSSVKPGPKPNGQPHPLGANWDKPMPEKFGDVKKPNPFAKSSAPKNTMSMMVDESAPTGKLGTFENPYSTKAASDKQELFRKLSDKPNDYAYKDGDTLVQYHYDPVDKADLTGLFYKQGKDNVAKITKQSSDATSTTIYEYKVVHDSPPQSLNTLKDELAYDKYSSNIMPGQKELSKLRTYEYPSAGYKKYDLEIYTGKVDENTQPVKAITQEFIPKGEKILFPDGSLKRVNKDTWKYSEGNKTYLDNNTVWEMETPKTTMSTDNSYQYEPEPTFVVKKVNASEHPLGKDWNKPITIDYSGDVKKPNPFKKK